MWAHCTNGEGVLAQQLTSYGIRVSKTLSGRDLSEGLWPSASLAQPEMVVVNPIDLPRRELFRQGPKTDDIHRVMKTLRREAGQSDAEEAQKPVGATRPNTMGADLLRLIQDMGGLGGLGGVGGPDLRALAHAHFAGMARQGQEQEQEEQDDRTDEEREQELENLVPMQAAKVAQLVNEMGFPEERARRALWLSRMDVNRATDLLLEDEGGLDQPLNRRQCAQVMRMFNVRRPQQRADANQQEANQDHIDDGENSGGEDEGQQDGASDTMGEENHSGLLEAFVQAGFVDAAVEAALERSNGDVVATLNSLFTTEGAVRDTEALSASLSAHLGTAEQRADSQLGNIMAAFPNDPAQWTEAAGFQEVLNDFAQDLQGGEGMDLFDETF